MNDKQKEERILKTLKREQLGLSITELAKKLKTSRHTIRVSVTRLEALGKVAIEKKGNNKIVYIPKKKRR